MITAIDARSIDQITSGQVVTSLSSAVKELVENSLDAKSSVIEIRVQQYGKQGFQIQDNGSGIDPEDFALVAKKHATSKLKTFEDLERVGTLGFRGEALASLCALSTVKIVTNCGTSLGYELEFGKNGDVVSTKQIPCPKGTLVSVEDLFIGLPVRRKDFERNCQREFTKLVALIQEYAILNSLRISLVNFVGNKRTQQVMCQGSKLMQRIACIYGAKRTKTLIEVDFEVLNARFKGIISKPAFGNGDSAAVCHLLAVNNRPVTLKKLVRVIVDAYKQFNYTEIPFFVLNLELDPARFDVNVSPDKRMVLLHTEEQLAIEVSAKFQEIFSEAAHEMPRMQQTLLPFAVDRVKQSSVLNKESDKMGNEYEEQVVDDGQGNNSGSDEENGIEGGSADEHSLEPSELSGPVREDQPLGSPEPVHSEDEQTQLTQLPSPTDTQIDTQNLPPQEPANDDFEPAEFEEVVPSDIPSPPADQQSDPELPSESQTPQSPPQQPGSPAFTPNESDSVDPPSPTESPPNLFVDIKPELDLSVPSESPPPPQKSDSNRKKLLNTHIHLPLTATAVQQATHTPTLTHKQLSKFAIDDEGIEERLSLTIGKQDFERMEVVGQFNLGFILVVNRKKNHDDLFVVDQHASDEIYNFERLQRQTVLSRQPLLKPQIIELSAVEELVIQNHLDVFENNGFSFQIDESRMPGQQCMLTTVPYSKNVVFDEKDVFELLSKIRENPNNKHLKCSRLRQMFAMRACRSSIMIGKPLTKSKMEEVVRNLGTLDKPWNCPHGRPTLRHITSLS